MDAIIDERFRRVEKALSNLITSISTYNPAPALASDLVSADASLNEGLSQLSTHQSNYLRILSLRALSTDLDTQIHSTLTLLTKTRTDLLATAATSYPLTTNPVSYSDLLSYARRISKFTLPPTYREPKASLPLEQNETGTPLEGKAGLHTNGESTPIAITNGAGAGQTPLPTAMEIDSLPAPAPAAAEGGGGAQNQTVKENTEKWSAFLNTSSSESFFPWPSESDIRRGALASIQILVDQGVDPALFDPEKSAELEAERKRIEEEGEAEKSRVEEERRREVERRGSVGGGLAVGERPRVSDERKVFQLETFDDDEDDD